MFKYKKLILLAVIASLILAGCAVTQEEAPTGEPVTEEAEQVIETETQETEQATEATESDSNGYGAAGAEEDPSYTLEEMLTYAIQDEYLARAEYEKIIQEFDVTRPFTNIMQAEETHIALLIPLFETYDIEIPEDTSGDHLIIPSELKAIFEIGVQAEIDNIAMYESFLKEDLPDDIRSAFESLKAASESHLLAFEKNLNRY